MPRRLTLQMVEQQIEELQRKADSLKEAQKPGIKQLKAVIAKYKLTAVDIRSALNGSRGSKKTSALRGIKLKPRYRNPDNKADTWAGRGMKPKWLSSLLKQGKKLEDFAA